MGALKSNQDGEKINGNCGMVLLKTETKLVVVFLSFKRKKYVFL